MTKSALLAAASVFALCSSSALAEKPTAAPMPTKSNPFHELKRVKLLYSQNSNDSGYPVNSQNFTSSFGPTYNDQAADDFVIPMGQKWTVAEVDVSGAYFNGSGGLAMSENVIFYKNNHGRPGSPARNGIFNNLKGTDNSGSFAIKLPGSGIRLKAGTYWVSVVANMEFFEHGEWGWEAGTAQYGNQAMWQNPFGGFGVCPTWDTIEYCVVSPAPDLMFELRGTTK